jgi:pimeloyl-ACP methyl ester carboxylesterase
MPLDWAVPSADLISVFASRRPAIEQPAKVQLWLLAGGPGGSGDSYSTYVDQLAKELPDHDLYVLEHRGVGESTRVGCPDQESTTSEGGVGITASEWPACLEAVERSWGNKLSHFTTTADARDLKRFIELTRAPGQKVFVYGASYGTTRALRLLQVDPAGVDGVILDSVVSPGVQSMPGRPPRSRSSP